MHLKRYQNITFRPKIFPISPSFGYQNLIFSEPHLLWINTLLPMQSLARMRRQRLLFRKILVICGKLIIPNIIAQKYNPGQNDLRICFLRQKFFCPLRSRYWHRMVLRARNDIGSIILNHYEFPKIQHCEIAISSEIGSNQDILNFFPRESLLSVFCAGNRLKVIGFKSRDNFVRQPLLKSYKQLDP